MPCNYLSYSYTLWISRTSTNISCQTSHKHQWVQHKNIQQPLFYSHQTGQPALATRIFLMQSFTLADGNQCIWIWEKTLELSSTVLSTHRHGHHNTIGGEVTKQHENRPSNRLTGEPQCWYGWLHTTSATERWPRVAPSDTGSWFLTRYHLPWQLPIGRCTSPTMLTLRCSMNLQQTYTGHTWLCKLKSSVILTQKHKLLYAL